MTLRFGIPRSKNEWILAILGLGVTIGCAVPLAQGVLSLSWPKTGGVITYSHDKPGYRVIGVDLRYRYTVDGREYTGNRYRFQFVLTGRKMRGRDVQSILGRYPVGEPVQISVNPADPSDSVIDAGPDFDTLFPFAIGLFLLLLGFGKASGPARQPARDGPRYGLARILAAMGIGLFLLGAYYLYRGLASASWPAVEGRIVYSHARNARSPETLLWYEYYVDRQRYVSSDYRAGGNVTPFGSVAEAAAKRYPAGRSVPVYYNPDNPRQAVLEPGVWWGNFVPPIFGVLLLGAAWVAKKFAEIMAVRRTSKPPFVSS